MRLLGPNTNGMICARSSVVASIMTTVADLDAAPPASEIALISQSGAIGAFVLSGCQEAGLPVGVYFSTGNEADVGFEELLGRVVDDPRISVVLTYVEGLRDGPAFVDAALRAASLGQDHRDAQGRHDRGGCAGLGVAHCRDGRIGRGLRWRAAPARRLPGVGPAGTRAHCAAPGRAAPAEPGAGSGW